MKNFGNSVPVNEIKDLENEKLGESVALTNKCRPSKQSPQTKGDDNLRPRIELLEQKMSELEVENKTYGSQNRAVTARIPRNEGCLQ